MDQMRKERFGMNKAEWTVVGFLLTLVLAILASLGWLYWQMSDVRERLTRIETILEYSLPPATAGELRQPLEQIARPE